MAGGKTAYSEEQKSKLICKNLVLVLPFASICELL
jgi:hypothetical protein